MSNINTLAYSGERLSFFQLFNEKHFQVEVPIIQRDYAQGRDNQSAVRKAFLDTLYEYLKQGKPNRDLDFVYGSIVENKIAIANNDVENKPLIRFIPLDGQQRLTTLFLLHWYLAQISGKADYLRNILSVNGHSLFTYETRNSSREFCDALIAHDLNLTTLLTTESGNTSVAATIKDAGWFYLSWSSDPTIRSMLTMLDAIHEKFEGCYSFFDLLVDSENPVITFLFLNLQEFKLTDDLYIKMNSRGKPLTHFENFKARLEKKIKSFDEPWEDYQLSFKTKPVSGYEYFIHKIDTDWAELFWRYRNEASKDDTYDDELMNFIALVTANFHLLSQNLESKLFGSGGNLRRLSFIEYEELGCLKQDLIKYLIEVLDLLHNNGSSNDSQIKMYLAENKYYLEEEIFKKVLTNNTSYPEKLRFYAFYEALCQGIRGEGLLAWMRVIFNLTENTIVNTVDEYLNCLQSIQHMVKSQKPILDLLKDDVSISAFVDVQITEEKIKAHLLAISSDWDKEIKELEMHPFFRGQIGFILKFAGIVDYYRIYGNTAWEEADSNYLKSFRYYARAAKAVFTSIIDSSKDINYAWERAVLTKGVYFTKTTADRFNLLSTRLTKNNIDRDHSWKRLLRLPTKKNDSQESTEWDKKQGFVKAVFDDTIFNINDLKGSLEAICKEAIKSSNVQEWQRLLIEEPRLFEDCKQGFIFKNRNEIILLHQSQRNHTQSELYSKYLYLKLDEGDFTFPPFSSFRYITSIGTDYFSYILIEGIWNNELLYEIHVWYESDQYHIVFFKKEDVPYPQPLIDILNGISFIEGNYQEDDAAYIFDCKTPSATKTQLIKLCNSLRVKSLSNSMIG